MPLLKPAADLARPSCWSSKSKWSHLS